jgi:hypothetical protein
MDSKISKLLKRVEVYKKYVSASPNKIISSRKRKFGSEICELEQIHMVAKRIAIINRCINEARPHPCIIQRGFMDDLCSIQADLAGTQLAPLIDHIIKHVHVDTACPVLHRDIFFHLGCFLTVHQCLKMRLVSRKFREIFSRRITTIGISSMSFKQYLPSVHACRQRFFSEITSTLYCVYPRVRTIVLDFSFFEMQDTLKFFNCIHTLFKSLSRPGITWIFCNIHALCALKSVNFTVDLRGADVVSLEKNESHIRFSNARNVNTLNFYHYINFTGVAYFHGLNYASSWLSLCNAHTLYICDNVTKAHDDSVLDYYPLLNLRNVIIDPLVKPRVDQSLHKLLSNLQLTSKIYSSFPIDGIQLVLVPESEILAHK